MIGSETKPNSTEEVKKQLQKVLSTKKSEVKNMKKKTIAGLVAVVAIIVLAAFFGGIGSKTPIHDIYENPDKYVDKEVTIKARTDIWVASGYGGIAGMFSRQEKGFGIEDIEASPSGLLGPEHQKIWVVYSGKTPQSEDFKGKWGESVTRTVRVKGIVRHAGGGKIFYIEGKSWEYKR